MAGRGGRRGEEGPKRGGGGGGWRGYGRPPPADELPGTGGRYDSRVVSGRPPSRSAARGGCRQGQLQGRGGRKGRKKRRLTEATAARPRALPRAGDGRDAGRDGVGARGWLPHLTHTATSGRRPATPPPPLARLPWRRSGAWRGGGGEGGAAAGSASPRHRATGHPHSTPSSHPPPPQAPRQTGGWPPLSPTHPPCADCAGHQMVSGTTIEMNSMWHEGQPHGRPVTALFLVALLSAPLAPIKLHTMPSLQITINLNTYNLL